MVEYISDSNLQVSSEDVVVEAVMKWVNHDLEARVTHFEQVLAHVRLPYCTNVYLYRLINKVFKKQGKLHTDATQKYLDEALGFQMLPDHCHGIISQRTIPRESFTVNRRLFLLGGLTAENSASRSFWYLRGDKPVPWEYITAIPFRNLMFYSVCCFQGNIVLTGGFAGAASRCCQMYNPSAGNWKEKSAMLNGRYNHTSVVNGDGVFVLGGEDNGHTILSSVECLKRNEFSWNNVEPMKKALVNPLAVSFDLSIFVFGGFESDGGNVTGKRASTSTQKYDTTWGEWTFVAEMPEPCEQGGVAVVNERVFLVGGFTRTCMSYKPALDSWTVLTPPSRIHGNAPAIVWKGKLLVGGGKDSNGLATSGVEEYDPESDKWSDFEHSLKS